MKGLTKRQREVVDFIDHFTQSHKYSPSYRDIMTHFGFSSLGSVYCHLQVLRQKGYLTDHEGCSRTLTRAKRQDASENHGQVQVAQIGFLSADGPIETLPQIHYVALPTLFAPNPEATYALRARGDSLVQENIADGDLVIVEVVSEPESGEMVIALVDGKSTMVRRYYPEGRHVRLKSSSATIAPVLVHSDKVTIQGVVIAVIRLYT